MERLVVNLSGGVRREKRDGRHYLVAPMTLIVPGVLNGSQGPLLYPLDEIERSAPLWNEVPLTVHHPYAVGGRHASASDPGVFQRQGVGVVRSARVEGKLIAEGWFDIEKTRTVNVGVLNLLLKGQRVELSTGLFTENEPAENGAEFEGTPYIRIARNYRPDHLAILPDQVGACSIQDGCGVLVNEESDEEDVAVAKEKRKNPFAKKDEDEDDLKDKKPVEDKVDDDKPKPKDDEPVEDDEEDEEEDDEDDVENRTFKRDSRGRFGSGGGGGGGGGGSPDGVAQVDPGKSAGEDRAITTDANDATAKAAKSGSAADHKSAGDMHAGAADYHRGKGDAKLAGQHQAAADAHRMDTKPSKSDSKGQSGSGGGGGGGGSQDGSAGKGKLSAADGEKYGMSAAAADAHNQLVKEKRIEVNVSQMKGTSAAGRGVNRGRAMPGDLVAPDSGAFKGVPLKVITAGNRNQKAILGETLLRKGGLHRGATSGIIMRVPKSEFPAVVSGKKPTKNVSFRSFRRNGHPGHTFRRRSSAMTEQERKKMAEFIVANCSYCDDEAVGNMGDVEITERYGDLKITERATAVLNAAGLPVDATPEQLKGKLTPTANAAATAPLNITKKPLTEQEWLSGAPDSIVQAVTFARNQEAEQRARLIESIVENSRREDDQPFIDALKTKPMDDLTMMASLVERPQRQAQAPVANFFGQAAAAPKRSVAALTPLPSNAEYEAEMAGR